MRPHKSGRSTVVCQYSAILCLFSWPSPHFVSFWVIPSLRQRALDSSNESTWIGFENSFVLKKSPCLTFQLNIGSCSMFFSALNAHGSRFSSRNGSNGRRFNVPEKKKMTRWPPFVQQRMLGRIFSSRSVPQTWSVKHFFWLRRKKRKYSGRSSSGGSIRNGNFPVSAKEEREKITRNYFCWTSQMDETSVQLGCSARGRCCLALHFFSLFR